jgi:hypothetical protein
MNSRTVELKQFTPKNSPAHPYKKYESHPYWKQLDKAISALVKNQDLLERTARPYIVGYLCQALLRTSRKPVQNKSLRRTSAQTRQALAA